MFVVFFVCFSSFLRWDIASFLPLLFIVSWFSVVVVLSDKS